MIRRLTMFGMKSASRFKDKNPSFGKMPTLKQFEELCWDLFRIWTPRQNRRFGYRPGQAKSGGRRKRTARFRTPTKMSSSTFFIRTYCQQPTRTPIYEYRNTWNGEATWAETGQTFMGPY